MRISTNYEYARLQAEVEGTSNAYTNAQQAVTTGLRINQLSDDPAGAATAVSINSLMAQIEQYNSNMAEGQNFLNTTDSALSQAANLVNSAYQLAVSGATSTNDQSARNAMASQIGDLQASLVRLANTQMPDGQYVFAGQNTSVQPFSVSSGKLNYAGDGGSVTVATGPSQTLAVNTPGSPLFTEIYAKLQALREDLAGGNLSKISSQDIPAMQGEVSNVNQIRGSIGAQVQAITSQTQDNAQRLTELNKSVSGITNVDMAAAIITMTQAQTAYQAALMVTAQANKLSLLNFIQ